MQLRASVIGDWNLNARLMTGAFGSPKARGSAFTLGCRAKLRVEVGEADVALASASLPHR